MIVIGADVHKSTHALAAVESATGQLRAIPVNTAISGPCLTLPSWDATVPQ